VSLTTEVMIAGGGPVGLTLALALSHFGVPCFVAERNESPTRHPKMDVTNCRSMEIFRRLGVVEALRAAAVPEENNMDVSWVTTMSGHELYRFRYPSVIEAREIIRARNDGSQPREPQMRISQVVLEPVLRDLIRERANATVRYGWAVESFTADADGVTTTIRHGDATETVRSKYLIGCDGAHSVVREGLGIGLEGVAATRPRFQIHFRSEARDVLQRWGIAWHYQSGPFGVMICQDDREIWTLNALVPQGEEPNPKALLRRFLGTDIDCEILQANPWTANLLVAESYGRGRVFIAGDAAHQYIPTGGYGMNTGVADAYDLAWKLAAMHDGWGGPNLLASYEAERRPVGLRNRDASRFHAETKQKIIDAWHVDTDTARAKLAERIEAIGNAENESLGIELGYRYDDSPIVCAEPGALPPDLVTYRPTARPGARAPNLFLSDGSALHDLFGPGFTLLDFRGKGATVLGVPIKTLRIDDANARRLYERDLVLVRPDQHVAWRGDALPQEVIFRAAGR
jgi:2-polyprenyl-6-methoxyphenol hydroxylase-like FAD-dependent oxidoreductase